MGAFVGRIDELALLSAIVAAGYDGDVAAAVAVGDPGSGKSRLLSEVAERAERSNAFRVVGYEPERQVPLGSAVDLLRALSDSTSTGRRLGALAFDAAWEERSTLEPMRVFEAAHRALRENWAGARSGRRPAVGRRVGCENSVLPANRLIQELDPNFGTPQEAGEPRGSPPPRLSPVA
jgi:hypothetical protein